MARMKKWNVKYRMFNPYSGYSKDYTTQVEAATEKSAINKANVRFRDENRRNASVECWALSAELA